ncbi:hypothetical protein QNI19_26350 [Cytophagaceae bacterium DM2B3-1]|uniref:Uncharacterized protein n=1 Tax=Xanthocytophaga flava TaxID=3048013 RepID=A0AAE3QWS3_9BACT|nr:hypothetical protein [Xanthocytophaga flavus]MDJ1484828.1 hypothetical protein [Xanthocytophaga flavus]MDJ1496485.1 hypothetical protein [Xanthocytophaga flavus]
MIKLEKNTKKTTSSDVEEVLHDIVSGKFDPFPEKTEQFKKNIQKLQKLKKTNTNHQ